jgi:CelD/BcsL family acetyltransferase involved in cellulose biosynthesis
MNFKEYAAHQLPHELYERWRHVQKSNSLFLGPCFHPELYRVAGEFFPQTKVGVVNHEGPYIGFLPYFVEKKRSLIGPVPGCDYQALIESPGPSTDIMHIIKGLGYAAWDFENLIAEQLTPAPSFVLKENVSRKIVIPGTYDSYVQELKRQGKSGKNLATKRRLLERDIGPIRFMSHTQDTGLLEMIYQWKTQRFGGFSEPLRKMIECILKTDKDGFRGCLSALYAKDTVVAVHFGMQADGTLFYWFPAFNPEMSKYSPGGLLLQELCSHLGDFQSSTLDLGPGGETYKDYFCNFKVALVCGSYELPSPLTCLRKFKRDILRTVRSNRLLYGAAKAVAKTARALKGS